MKKIIGYIGICICLLFFALAACSNDQNSTPSASDNDPVGSDTSDDIDNTLPFAENTHYIEYIEVIPLIYDYVSSFKDGLAIVRIGDEYTGKWGVIDTAGNEVIPIIYNYISEVGGDSTYEDPEQLHDGNYWYVSYYKANYGGEISDNGRIVSGKWGILSRTGEIVVPLEYDDIYTYLNDDVATVMEGNTHIGMTYGLFELSTGREIIPTGIYTGISQVREGRAAVYTGNRARWGIIDLYTGELLTSMDYSSIRAYHNGATMAEKGNNSARYGYIDINGREMTPFIFSQNSSYFINGVARAGHEGKWGLIDTEGTYLIQPVYENYFDHYRFNNYMSVSSNNLWGIIDTENAVEIIPPTYTSLSCISEKLAIVSMGDWNNRTYGVIDIESNEFVVPLKYSSLEHIDNNFAIAATGTQGTDYNVGVIDIFTGETVIDFVFDEIRGVLGGVYIVKSGGVWQAGEFGYYYTGGQFGIYNEDGHEIISPLYKDIRPLFNTVYGFRTEDMPILYAVLSDKWGIANSNGDIVLPFEYDYIGWLYEGYVLVNIGGEFVTTYSDDGENSSTFTFGKWGLVNSEGNIVIPVEMDYDQVLAISEGMAAVCKDGKWGFITLISE